MTDTKISHIFLAIDGSTPVCSVALRVGGSYYDQKVIGMGIHSNAIFSQINELLSTAGIRFADIGAILIGIGPGSYTGLRVVASSIKGMLFNSSVPLYGVNTLSGFAACVPLTHSGTIHTIIDARRNHVYYQSFRYTHASRIESKCDPELLEIPALYSRLHLNDTLIGTGIERLDTDLLDSVHVFAQDNISATGLIRIFDTSKVGDNTLVEALDPAGFEPKYAIEDFIRL